MLQQQPAGAAWTAAEGLAADDQVRVPSPVHSGHVGDPLEAF